MKFGHIITEKKFCMMVDAKIFKHSIFDEKNQDDEFSVFEKIDNHNSHKWFNPQGKFILI